MKGLFVVLEGIDGCGKSTQAERLGKYFKELGRSALSLKEPGGTPLGERVRQIFLDENLKIEPLTEILLIEASRHELTEQVIRPALQRGEVVICQRYTYSSLAYQGFGRNLSLGWIEALNEAATGGLKPDIAFLLDLPVEEGLRRLKSARKPDRIESAGASFLQKVAAGYHKLLELHPEMSLVNATLNEDAVFDELIESLKEIEGG